MKSAQAVYRFGLAAAVTALVSATSFAAGKPWEWDRPPTRAQLEYHAREACIMVLRRDDNLPSATAASRCGCFASRMLRSLTAAEYAEVRASTRFTPPAREKAVVIMRRCRVVGG